MGAPCGHGGGVVPSCSERGGRSCRTAADPTGPPMGSTAHRRHPVGREHCRIAIRQSGSAVRDPNMAIVGALLPANTRRRPAGHGPCGNRVPVTAEAAHSPLSIMGHRARRRAINIEGFWRRTGRRGRRVSWSRGSGGEHARPAKRVRGHRRGAPLRGGAESETFSMAKSGTFSTAVDSGGPLAELYRSGLAPAYVTVLLGSPPRRVVATCRGERWRPHPQAR